MKKVYTMLPQQETHYTYYGNAERELYKNCQEKVKFAIEAYLADIIEEGERFKLIIIDSFDNEMSEYRYNELKNNVESKYKDSVVVERLCLRLDENTSSQVNLFKGVYKTFEENDEVYFDITFGLKPNPISVMIALNYGVNFINNFKVKRIVYAYYKFGMPEDYVHPFINITSLFYMNQLVEKMGQMGIQDPTAFIDMFIK